jgi:peptide deformylase
MTAPYSIRVFGDPVLKMRCNEITDISDATRALAADMLTTMYEAPGVGLAGNQVGVQQRIFVYDAGDGPGTILNPVIVESSGTWEFEEGCLSVPGLYFKFFRPRSITLQGIDLEGNDVVFEVTDYLARVFQHETDHLNGSLILDRLDPDQKKRAMRALRDRQMKS